MKFGCQLTIITGMKRSMSLTLLAVIIMAMAILTAGCSGSGKNVGQLKEDGQRALGRGEFKKAVEIYRQAFRMEPSDRDVLYGLGMAYKNSFQHDSALAVFRRARVLFVYDREINAQLLELCPQIKDFEGAINAINCLIAAGDNERQYWLRLADFYYHNEQYELAVKYFRLLLADNPDQPSHYMYLSGALAIMREFAEANEILKQGIERFGPSAEVYVNMGINYINLHNHTDAEEYLRLALDLNPGSIPTLFNLANVLSSQKSREKKLEALEIYKASRDLTPEAFKVDSIIDALQSELGVK